MQIIFVFLLSFSYLLDKKVSIFSVLYPREIVTQPLKILWDEYLKRFQSSTVETVVVFVDRFLSMRNRLLN